MARFLMLLKNDENPALGAPPQELFEAVGRAAEEWSKAGVLLDTGGLAPLAISAQVRLAGGTISRETNPFVGAKEPVAAYAIVEAADVDEAAERGSEFLALHQKHWRGWEGASEVRQIFGA